MRIIKSNIGITLAAIVLLTHSCIEYYSISTKIFKDGRLLRSITIKADKGSIHSGSIKIPTDSTWNITKVFEYENPHDTNSDEEITYTAKKLFANTGELNQFLADTSDTNKIVHIATHIDKNFRWFYTYLTYSETYQKKFPYDHFSLDEYMTNEQYDILMHEKYVYLPASDTIVRLKDVDLLPLLNHTDSLRMKELYGQLEERFWQWVAKNIFYEAFTITQEALQIQYPELVLNLNKQYDSLMLIAEEHHLLELFDDSDDPTEAIAQLLHISEDSLIALNPERFRYFDECLEYALDIFNDNTIYNEVEMPGILLTTNADSIYNQQCFWIYSENDFIARNVDLVATARLTNVWAFVVSGIIIILLAFGGVKRVRRL